MVLGGEGKSWNVVPSNNAKMELMQEAGIAGITGQNNSHVSPEAIVRVFHRHLSGRDGSLNSELRDFCKPRK